MNSASQHVIRLTFSLSGPKKVLISKMSYMKEVNLYHNLPIISPGLVILLHRRRFRRAYKWEGGRAGGGGLN